MSAIYGIIKKTSSAQDEMLSKQFIEAHQKVRHDRFGSWEGQAAELGIFLRHNTPESLLEETPLEKHGVVLVADARIDNRDELFSALNIPIEQQESFPDNQLIVEAYRKWGPDCPDHLLGDFAFAIWDKKEQTLFCARDHMGIRPFYYFVSDTALYFSSRIDTLCAILPGKPDLENEGVVNTFLNIKGRSEKTVIKNILRLRPAHLLSFSNQQLQTSCYWIPKRKTLSIGKDECHETLRKLLIESVRCRTRSTFPLGSHLSGGLDSSIVACIASQALKKEDKTVAGFSWSFTPDKFPTGDERDDIECLRNWGNFSVNYTDIEDLSLPDFLSSSAYDGMPNQFMREHGVIRKAASSGIRTLLSGWGGDEFITIHGEERFSEVLGQFRFFELMKLIIKQRKTSGRGMKSQLFKAFHPFIPDIVYYLSAFQPVQQAKICLLNKSIRGFTEKPDKPFSSVQKKQYSSFTQGAHLHRVEGWAAVGQIHGTEYAYPLLDKRLIEFCLSVPGEFHMQDGASRSLARNALTGLLPEQIRLKETKAEGGLLADKKEFILKSHEESFELLEKKRNSPLYSQLFDDDEIRKYLHDLKTGEPRLGRLSIIRLIVSTLTYLEQITRSRFPGSQIIAILKQAKSDGQVPKSSRMTLL